MGFGLRASGFGLIVVAACGGTSAPLAPSGPPAQTITPPASPEDVVVARVDGRPVYGSCVAAQLARANISRETARDQCIAFELMARAAERRGLATDPAVVAATRTALVSTLVDRGYERAFRTRAEFGDAWDRITTNQDFYRRVIFQEHKHPEMRSSAYVRDVLPKTPAPSAADEADAHALADQIAAAAAPEVGLLGPHLVDIARRAAPGHAVIAATDKKQPPGTIEYSDVPPYAHYGKGGLEEAYVDALFAVPEVGRTAPAAVRTSLGWDVIAWTGVAPALDPSPDELAAELVPDVQRAYFAAWVGGIAKQLGVRVEVDDAVVKRLDEGAP
jgi:hypothetical protein